LAILLVYLGFTGGRGLLRKGVDVNIVDGVKTRIRCCYTRGHKLNWLLVTLSMAPWCRWIPALQCPDHLLKQGAHLDHTDPAPQRCSIHQFVANKVHAWSLSSSYSSPLMMSSWANPPSKISWIEKLRGVHLKPYLRKSFSMPRKASWALTKINWGDLDGSNTQSE